MWGTHIQSEIEKKGIPTIDIITTPFIKDAQAAADLFGIPHLRKLVLPHPIADLSEAQIEQYMVDASDEIIQGLTSPLRPEEVETGVVETPAHERYVFEGTMEQVQSQFVEMGLSDGLPIIPPTEENLKRMLQGTSHSPDEVIGKMPPENFEATVEKVAINGIMAGCKPEYMPVLLAVAEALIEPELKTATGARSTNSFAFWGMVNGPIAAQIGMNDKKNALGPGNHANATIGRAIRLFLTNLGGSSPEINDMSSQGNVVKYGFSFAENEEDSPWDPFHVDHGFKPEESAVTIFKSLGFRTVDRSIGVPEIGLESIAWTAENIGGVFGVSPNRGLVLLLDPLLAKHFEDKGISKHDVKEYLWLKLRKTVEEWRGSYNYTVDVRTNLYPKWYSELSPDDMIPKFESPERISVIVVGGQTNPVYQIYEAVSPGEGITISVDKWK